MEGGRGAPGGPARPARTSPPRLPPGELERGGNGTSHRQDPLRLWLRRGGGGRQNLVKDGTGTAGEPSELPPSPRPVSPLSRGAEVSFLFRGKDEESDNLRWGWSSPPRPPLCYRLLTTHAFILATSNGLYIQTFLFLIFCKCPSA